MERELPVHDLKGVAFQVNVKNAELIEIDTPFVNSIKLNELEDRGTHYVLHWNEKEKNNDSFLAYSGRAMDGKGDFSEPRLSHHLKKYQEEQSRNIIKIPPMKDLDPVGMSELYNVPVNSMKEKTDYEIMVNQHLLNRRKMGVLPIAKIGLHDFIVDLKLDVILPLLPSQAQFIKFSRLEHFTKSDGSAYMVPWDMKTGQIARTDFQSLTEIPTNVKYVEIPKKEILDPFGYYSKYGTEKELIYALRTVPIKEKIEARIVDLSETAVPELIEKNKQRKLSQWARNEVQQRSKNRVKKGV